MRSPARVQGFFVSKCQGVPPCVADVKTFASLKAGREERMGFTLRSLAQKPLKHFLRITLLSAGLRPLEKQAFPKML